MTLDTERIDRLEGISDKLTSAVLTIYELTRSWIAWRRD